MYKKKLSVTNMLWTFSINTSWNLFAYFATKFEIWKKNNLGKTPARPKSMVFKKDWKKGLLLLFMQPSQYLLHYFSIFNIAKCFGQERLNLEYSLKVSQSLLKRAGYVKKNNFVPNWHGFYSERIRSSKKRAFKLQFGQLGTYTTHIQH